MVKVSDKNKCEPMERQKNPGMIEMEGTRGHEMKSTFKIYYSWRNTLPKEHTAGKMLKLTPEYNHWLNWKNCPLFITGRQSLKK